VTDSDVPLVASGRGADGLDTSCVRIDWASGLIYRAGWLAPIASWLAGSSPSGQAGSRSPSWLAGSADALAGWLVWVPLR
jgi:hypothetical protein